MTLVGYLPEPITFISLLYYSLEGSLLCFIDYINLLYQQFKSSLYRLSPLSTYLGVQEEAILLCYIPKLASYKSFNQLSNYIKQYNWLLCPQDIIYCLAQLLNNYYISMFKLFRVVAQLLVYSDNSCHRYYKGLSYRLQEVIQN